MKKSILMLTAIIFAVATYTSAFAWGPGQGKYHGKGQKGECPRGEYKWGANLTDDQEKQLQELHDQYVDDTADTRIKLNAKQEELRILMGTSDPNREELKTLAKEVSDLRGDLMAKQIDFRLEAKKISPELNFGKGFGGFGDRGHGPRYHGKGGPGKFCGKY